MKTICAVLLSCLFTSTASLAENKISQELREKARAFMESQNLIREDDEADSPRFGLSTKWELSDIRQHGAYRLMIMKLVSRRQGKVTTTSQEFEVFVEKGVGSKKQFLLFEDAYDLPSRLVARIGKGGEGNFDDYGTYYVELLGSSAVNALKSTYTGILYHGFSGIVISGGKAKFDPTPNRIWRVVDAQFDLRRGKSAEVLDIQSYQLDKDFEGFARGVQKKSSDGTTGAHVAPWGQSAVLEIVQ